MATVNWPKAFGGLKNDDFYDYGFDFRDVLTEDLADPTTEPVPRTETKTIEFSGTELGFISTEQYGGNFIIEQNVLVIAPGLYSITNKEVTGTITSFTRRGSNEGLVGTIKGLNIDYEDAAAAAKTASTTDDMVLWAEAFTGNDVFSGSPVSDRLEGFSGNDSLKGNVGADKLFGGEGGDSFIFTSIKDSTVKSAGRDIVYDFSHSQKDKIDLKAIDASTKTTGNQAFKYIGSQDFHKKAGELRWEKVTGGVAVYGDVNGDGKADFSITFRQIAKLAKDDFLL